MTDRKRAFEALDLPADASPEQIKQAYRELVQIWHPDRYVHNTRLRARAEERMLIINGAYRALTAVNPFDEGTGIVEEQHPVASAAAQSQQTKKSGGLLSAVFAILGFLLLCKMMGWWVLILFVPTLIWLFFKYLYQFLKFIVLSIIAGYLSKEPPKL